VSPRTALIVGATSDIALALARRCAERGMSLVLAARRPEALVETAEAFAREHGVDARVVHLDLMNHEDAVATVRGLEPAPDLVAVVGAVMVPAMGERPSIAEIDEVVRTNLLGCAAVLEASAERLAERGAGAIVGVSSVAGDRGRGSNYLYGSSKAGVTAYLSGLRARMAPAGVHVLTVKPGLIRTRMTEGRSLPPLLSGSPDRVARAILRALDGKRSTIYVPWIWRWIMLVIRTLPEPLFRRLRI
jgi:hypothetical protein